MAKTKKQTKHPEESQKTKLSAEEGGGIVIHMIES